MKSFRRPNIAPIALKANDTQEIAELKREFNQKIKDIEREVDAALKSLVGGTLDMGLWCGGEIVTIYGEDAADGNKDLAVRHHLGAAPQYWLPLRQTWHGGTQEANTGPNNLIEGAATWTATHVYFRVPDACFSSTGGSTFKVLLIP